MVRSAHQSARMTTRGGIVSTALCVLLTSSLLSATAENAGTSVHAGFNGTPVEEGNYTNVVSVRVNGKHVNVGVIISPEYVLTEAWHYVNYTSPDGVSVRSGSVDALNGGTVRSASRVVPHPEYQHPHNDIALIKVSPPFTNEEIAELPQPSQTWPGDTKAVMVAWGGFSEDVLTTLKSGGVTILSEEDCASRNLDQWYPNEQICVVSDDLTSGLCDGDYGAPLLVDNVVAGINIFNYCGNSTTGELDRFIDITPLLGWINDNML